MPLVSFEAIPDSARVWVFGSDRPITGDAATALLKGVDEYLVDWKAHGAPLTVSREWAFDRFLVVAVDQSTAGATGCSIDGLFRTLQQLEKSVGANLVAGGRVFYRDNTGTVQSVSRNEIESLASSGVITKDTVVFDTTISDLGTWRACFERRAKETWVKELLGEQ